MEMLEGIQTFTVINDRLFARGMDHIKNLKVKYLRVQLWNKF